MNVAKTENSVIMYEEDYTVKYEGFNPNEPESYIIFEFMANEFLDLSVYFASLVQNQLVSSSKRVNRNVRQAGFLVLRQEEAYLKSSKGQTSIATSIYNGFKEYKREYDKKSFVFTNSSNTAPSTAKTGSKEYRIQFLTSSKKLDSGSSLFKGLQPVDYYYDGGIYKYTYGNSLNHSQIQKDLREVKKKFKDAFVIEFENGHRVK